MIETYESEVSGVLVLFVLFVIYGVGAFCGWLGASLLHKCKCPRCGWSSSQ
jgi:hypothetical protein